MRLLISALFLLSGATALVYQVAWSRQLMLVFGASHQAVSIVLSAFMAGLGLGSVVLGRRAEGFGRPLRAYGLLECGVAAAALLLPLLLLLVQRAYVAAALRIGDVGWSLNAVRAAFAFLVLVIPTFFMGGTLPVLVRAVVGGLGEFGSRLAWLYGINTAGAVAGAAVSGFILLPHIGVQRTQLVAVAVNASVGVLAVLAGSGRRFAALAPAAPPSRDDAGTRSAPPAGSPPAGDPRRWALRLAYAGTFVSGLCALALEVMWTRAIGTATGTTTYSFTIMLCAFLVGIVIGSTLHGLIPLRRVAEPVQFGVVLGLVGLTGVLVSQQIPRLPQLAVELDARFYGGAAGIRAASTLLLAFAVMLVPTTFMGVAFPLAGRAGARLSALFGRTVGNLVGLNTLGGILGPLLAGFALIPVLGLQRGMLLVCGLDLAYGVFVLAAALAARLPRPRVAVAVAALVAAALGAVLPAALPGWDLHTLGAFQNNVSLGYADEAGRIDVRGRLASAQVLYYEEGRAATVSVVESQGYRAFLINGKSEATDYQSDLQHEYLLGHLPVLLHPHPRTALVIGLGAGLTLGGVAAHPELERITMVEIEPAVVGAARVFADLNGGALDDPRVRLVVQDGRNYLLTSPERFDVITADPIHPWAYGAAYLYTTEYYAILRDRLSADGILCQWMPIYELSDADLRCIVATFCRNFEHTLVWQTAFDAVLIGSQRPIRQDLERLDARLHAPRVAAQLARIGTDDPLSFLAELALDDAGVRRYAQGGVVNTDDNLRLEFSSPRSIGNRGGAENILKIDALRVTPAVLVGGWAPRFASRQELEATLGTYLDAKRRSVQASLVLESLAQMPARAGWESVIDDLRRIVADVPAYGRARVQLAEALTGLGRAHLVAGELAPAESAFRAALDADPGNAHAHFQRAALLLQQGRVSDALPELERTLALRPRYPGGHRALGAALSILGQHEAAALQLQRAVALEPRNPEAFFELAVVETRRHQLEQAVAHYERALALDPRHVRACANLSLVLAQSGRLDAAIAAARRAEALAAQASDPELLERIRTNLRRIEAGSPL